MADMGAGEKSTSRGGLIGASFLIAPVSGLLGYFAGKILDRWGVLNGPAETLGDYLKAHVTGSDLAMFVGFAASLVCYLFFLRLVWKRTSQVYDVEGSERLIVGSNSQPKPTMASAPMSTFRHRDTDLVRALGYALTGEWRTVNALGLSIVGEYRSFERTIEKFRSAAANGDLRTWGKGIDGIFQEIPSKFWETNTVDKDAMLSFMPESRSQRRDGATGESFRSIMVNRAEIERVWPHAR